MKKHIKIILMTIGAALITACETVPEKVEAPKPPVTAADAASAIMAADVAIGKAKQRKHLWRDTTKILDKADNAMAADEYREARDLANKARVQAEVAVTQSYRGDALFLIKTLRKDYMDKMYAGQKKRLTSAEAALSVGREQVAYDTASMLMAEMQAQMDDVDQLPVIAEPVVSRKSAPEPVAEQKSKPTISKSGKNTYTVNSKDNLWDIAAKPEVYGNSDMWPLLWKANKDKINKPDDIATGLSLTIDRSASSESVAAAIKHSKLRGAPSLGPVDAFDQQYLNK
jgi:nucleoid-associated protein YgaU